MAQTDKGRSALKKLVDWPLKIFFVLILNILKYLLPLIWTILKFIFSSIKKIFTKETDSDSNGNLDGIKLILKKFTVKDRADFAEKTTKLKKILENSLKLTKK